MSEQINTPSQQGSQKNEKKCCCKGNCKKFFIIAVIIVIITFLFIFFIAKAPTTSQDMGLGDYTQEELNEMYPQIQNADVETRTSPAN
ncbi:hypothetical protein ACFL23_02265 [Patescibacteria group bacterium]